MITLQQYFGKWATCPDATPERVSNAQRMLACVENLELLAIADGVVFPDHERSGDGLHVYDDNVSGQYMGGFRPQTCTQGAPHSSHKEGLAVDRYDPHGEIDTWCMKNFDKLEQCGIYIEHPDSTPGWSHWTIREPASGHRAFYP